MRVLIDNANRSYLLGVEVALEAAGIRFKSQSNRGPYPNRMILVAESDYARAVEAVATVIPIDDDSITPRMRYAVWAFIAVLIIAWVALIVRG
jgi:hypothetical protein